MGSNTDDDDCIGYARECVRLAGLTQDPELQDQLLDMAREWMATAMHEAKTPKPKSLPAQPASIGVPVPPDR
jgi:hypothetical protein